MDRQQLIEEIQKRTNKKFGANTLIVLPKDDSTMKLTSSVRNVISWGPKNLDVITCRDRFGKYGAPRGKVIFMVGKPASGKTTTALELVASAQRDHNAIVYFVDQEHRLDVAYAKRIGVMTECMFISQPDTTEEAIQIIGSGLDYYMALARGDKLDKAEEVEEKEVKRGFGNKKKGKVKKDDREINLEEIPPLVIVWDTFSASPTEKEFTEHKTSGMGEHSRLSSSMLRQISGKVGRLGAILLVLNQEKQKIKTGWTAKFPEKAFLGESPQLFHSSIGLSTRRIEFIKGKHKRRVGIRTLIVMEKNSLAAPFQETVVDIYFGKGIDKKAAMFEALMEKKMIKKVKGGFAIEEINETFKDFEEFCTEDMYPKLVSLLEGKKKKVKEKK